MRRGVKIVLGLVLVLSSIFSVRTHVTGQNGDKRPVDLKSDRIFPVPVGDSTGYALVGNVVLFHNGAVITCDSLVRYDARHMDCFGNVVINQDSLYVYGDRVEYDGDYNVARVFSPLIKITDGNAVMYTYNFSFNTRTNIGEFSGGGTVSQDEYKMEAQNGFYYADTKVMVGVGDVLLRNSNYLMESDSVSYNLNTEQATFHKRSHIWNDKGEILSADSGDYFKAEDRYRFYSNAYILTEEQELWADSLDYAATVEEIEMWNNIQAVDVKNNSMAFGDYAHYISSEGKGVLTQDPAVLRYEKEGADTLYMRADSIYVYEVDSLGYFELNRPDSVNKTSSIKPIEQPVEEEFSFEQFAEQNTDAEDEIEEAVVAETGTETESPEEAAEVDEKELKRQAKKEAKEERRNQKQAERESKKQKRKGDVQQAEIEQTELPTELSAENVPTEETLQPVEVVEKVEEMPETDVAEEVKTEEEIVTEEKKQSEKKTDRVVLGYRNVKIFRKDFQAVCDSLLGFSVDSTIEMHVKPILWSEDNQITSNDVKVYTERQQLKQAVFTGNPIMASQVDTVRYNQVNGKTLTAQFVEGAISRVDVSGNVKTYYYMVDDSDDTVQGFLDATSADLTFEIEDNQVVKITFRTEPVYTIYPMDQIPSENSQRFEGFEWRGKERPVVEEIISRDIRESERDYYLSLVEPEFEITDSIIEYRDALVNDGSWADRDDKLTEDTIYFITTREP